MATQARPRHAASISFPAPTSEVAALVAPALHSRSGLRERLANAAPLTLSLLLATSLLWAPLFQGTATVYALALTAFYGYWVLRSHGMAIACLVGGRRIARWARTDWAARYVAEHADRDAWNWPRHLVVIPNYRESEEELRRTLDSLATQQNAQQLVVVLAMEEREAGADAKAGRLLRAFASRFGDLFATFHPAGIPGEAPGKGSNEAWAVRKAHGRLIARGGDDIARYTITSCDADAMFPPHHFTVLNWLFLTAADPTRTFWQPAIFNTNNIWDIPAPLRIIDGLSGINGLANLVLPGTVLFPTSCYSLTWQMLHEADYWDAEVIPEDWHIFLKSSFMLGDRVHVEPMWVRVGNDCVLTAATQTTLRARYFQAVRHAFGAFDIPYAWRAFWSCGPLGLTRRLSLAGTLTKVHVLWVAQWYLVTLGVMVPTAIARARGVVLPEWWSDAALLLPGVTLHVLMLPHPDLWLSDATPLLEPAMHFSVPGLLAWSCTVPLVALAIIEYRARGPRPVYVSRWGAVRSLLVWPLMAPITYFWACLPALHAQWRLASGRGLVYRVAEKGTRVDLAAATAPEVYIIVPRVEHIGALAVGSSVSAEVALG